MLTHHAHILQASEISASDRGWRRGCEAAALGLVLTLRIAGTGIFTVELGLRILQRRVGVFKTCLIITCMVGIRQRLLNSKSRTTIHFDYHHHQQYRMHRKLTLFKQFISRQLNQPSKQPNVTTETMAAAPRVFVTGVSGYLGGHTVTRIMEQHPEWNVVVLVRSEEQKNIILARWPKIEVVLGDLDTKELLIEEGKKADVVLRMSILILDRH